MGESIQCWQCGTRMTLDELASNDGDCPRCEVEVHLAEYLDNALSKVATLEAENAKLRAELERRAVPDGYRWYLVPKEDTDAFNAACSAANDAYLGGVGPCWVFIAGYRAMLAAAPSAPKADPVKAQLLEALEELMYAHTDKAEALAESAIAEARKGEGE